MRSRPTIFAALGLLILIGSGVHRWTHVAVAHLHDGPPTTCSGCIHDHHSESPADRPAPHDDPTGTDHDCATCDELLTLVTTVLTPVTVPAVETVAVANDVRVTAPAVRTLHVVRTRGPPRRPHLI